MESIPEGKKARAYLFYAKSNLLLHCKSCTLEQDGIISRTFSWYSLTFDPVPALVGDVQDSVWGTVRERAVACTLQTLVLIVFPDRKFRPNLFLSQMDHLPRPTLSTMVSSWPFSFPEHLCCLRSYLHIASQQLFGEESCVSYNQLKIFTWVWGFVFHHLTAWSSTGHGKKSPKPTQRKEGWERRSVVVQSGLWGSHTIQDSMSKSHLDQVSKNLSLAYKVFVSGWGYGVVCWGLIQVCSPVSSSGTFTLQLLWGVPAKMQAVLHPVWSVHGAWLAAVCNQPVGLHWPKCKPTKLSPPALVWMETPFKEVPLWAVCFSSALDIGQKLFLCPYGPTRTRIELSVEGK